MRIWKTGNGSRVEPNTKLEMEIGNRNGNKKVAPWNKLEKGARGKAFMCRACKNIVGVVNGARHMSVFVYANRESITVYSTQAFAH